MPSIPQQLLQQLAPQTHIQNYWVAFSGGVDSHVLLHALYGLADKLPGRTVCAVHIHHGLMADADQWAEFCRATCARYNVTYRAIHVNARASKGESPEAKAREVRYHALKSLIRQNDCLLTAHHQDDQAETLLLQLLRGSGPRGLAAMPMTNKFAQGQITRPLLNTTRAQIEHYARNHQLRWMEDSSNADIQFDRNYLRTEVIPILERRWPSFSNTVARTARLCAQAVRILDEEAQRDLPIVQGRRTNTLSIKALSRLSLERQGNVIRHWLKQLSLPTPSERKLRRLYAEVLTATPDATPLLIWSGCEIRRYRDEVYAMASIPPHDSSIALTWADPDRDLAIEPLWVLRFESGVGCGLNSSLIAATTVSVRFRRGGERCRLPGRAHHHSLKKLLQELSVPPWMRDRIPLLYLDNQLAAVGDYVVCEPFAAGPAEPGVALVCEPWHIQAEPENVVN